MRRCAGVAVAVVLWSGRLLACDTPWLPLSSGPITGPVNACTIWNDGTGEKLVVGGEFAAAGGTTCNGIAVWNGTAFSALGQGLGGNAGRAVYALCVYNGDLIAGGNFTPFTQPVNKVARWDASVGNWVPMGDLQGTVSVRAMTVFRGELYIGGEFLSSFALPGAPSAMLKWNSATSAWARVPGVTSAQAIHALAVFNNELYAGGSFASIGPTALGRGIAKFDGAAWHSVHGTGANVGIPTGNVWALHVYRDELVIGGQDIMAPPFTAPARSGLLRYVPSSDYGFESVGDDYSMVANAMTTYGDRLIVGGYIPRLAGTNGAGVGAWNGHSWDRIGGQVFGVMRAFAEFNGSLYAGGDFGNTPWASPPATFLGKLSCDFCAADLDDGTGQGQRDNAVGVEDLVYFLVQFESGALGADVDGGAGDGTPDGAVTIDDLIHFLIRFEAGC